MHYPWEIPSDLDDLDWPGLLLHLVDNGYSTGRAIQMVQCTRDLLEAPWYRDSPEMTAAAMEHTPKMFAVLGLIRLH